MAARENLPKSIGNGINTTLVSSITISALSLQVNDPAGINTTGGYIVVDFGVAGKEEVMYVESRSSNTLNIATDGRGLGGTSAVSHDAGATVQDVLIDEMINNMRASFLVEHDEDGAHTAINAALALSGNTINTGNKILDASGSNTASGTAVSSTNKLIDRGLYHGIEGQMMNGKLSVTVASNNLTVAVKTLADEDPSVASPVSVLINGSIRTITTALSVTKNAGTKWCNAGSSELATNEVDYFVYLGYNATDGVTIGFSRIPYARAYSEFSTTSTNEKYCAISTITNAASTDPYVVVGRFAATLSAGAGYTWSVPTFTAINLVSMPIFESRSLRTNYQLTYDGGGGSNLTPTRNTNDYRIDGRIVTVFVDTTMNASLSAGTGSVQLSTPFACDVSGGILRFSSSFLDVSDASRSFAAYAQLADGASQMICAYSSQDAAAAAPAIAASDRLLFVGSYPIG